MSVCMVGISSADKRGLALKVSYTFGARSGLVIFEEKLSLSFLVGRGGGLSLH